MISREKRNKMFDEIAAIFFNCNNHFLTPLTFQQKICLLQIAESDIFDMQLSELASLNSQAVNSILKSL